MNIVEFWNNVNIGEPGECWEWQRYRTPLPDNYGRVRYNGKMRAAHRVAWIFINGEIPEGLCVCHHCDNPPCCNPKHLFLGTKADNAVDREVKGRGTKKKVRGEECSWSKLTETQVLEIRSRYATGDILQRELAAEYGVCFQHISGIIRRRKWKHI